MLSGVTARLPWRRLARSPLQPDPSPCHAAAPDVDCSSTVEDVEGAELLELNSCLDVLADVFPDVRPDVFRDMITQFSRESRLELITEALLKNKPKYVKGRWLAPGQQTLLQQAADDPLYHIVEARDRFRSTRYRDAVKAAFYQEFRGLSHSSIKAVLAENNASYTASRPVLIALVNRSWRFAFTNLFARRKPPSLHDHPFIEWREHTDGTSSTSTPHLHQTGSTELNDELETTVLRPLLDKIRIDRLAKDEALALQLNEEEAEAANALYDCECCFTSTPFERVSACSSSAAHYICFDCVARCLNEALFGQGWAQSVDQPRATLKCIAATASGGACSSYIPRDLVQRALDAVSDNNPAEQWRKFDARLAADALAQSDLNVAKCPACGYAELNLPVAVDHFARLRPILRYFTAVLLIIVLIFTTPLLNHPIACTSLFLFLFFSIFSSPHSSTNSPHTKAQRIVSTHGRKFRCRSPSCLRTSCLICGATWHDPHECYKTSRAALKAFIDSAATAAVTRTCPSCSLSFVKDSGCNKMICSCGHAMCFVCRADLSGEGYAHFCPHFRPNAERECGKCERCDLYRTEDEEVMLRKVREEAEREWWRMENGNQSNKKAEF